MKNPIVDPKPSRQQSERFLREDIVDYYENTSLDYGTWSRNYNMHFGYWKKWMNPFRREPMLEEMNKQVMMRLAISSETQEIYDLGCGLGATMRTFAKMYPTKSITGVSLVDWQVHKARELNKLLGLDDQIRLIKNDYLNLPLTDGSVDRAFAVESCCHSPGEDKAQFLDELFRIIKPGGRCVVVDGFTKIPREQFGRVFKYCLDRTCSGWALPCFPSLSPFLRHMHQLGFEDIRIEDASWRIAPSAVHSPFCVLGFLIRKRFQGERLNRIRLGHLRSCFLGLFLGMSRRQFGYYIISARKQVSRING